MGNGLTKKAPGHCQTPNAADRRCIGGDSGTAAALSSMTSRPAQAFEGVDSNSSCFGGFRGFTASGSGGSRGDPYIRAVPGRSAPLEQDRAVARDREWQARCRPVKSKAISSASPAIDTPRPVASSAPRSTDRTAVFQSGLPPGV